MKTPDAFRLIQVSDSHLSARQGFFVDNFVRTAAAINRRHPHLVVHTGDLSINGVETVDDLWFARRANGLLNAPVLCLPGNHDVGEEPGFESVDQPVSVRAVERYRRVFGPDRWVFDLPGWRLLGLNSQLFGTGLAAEAAQEAWAEECLAGRPASGVGVFLHKPLCFPRGIRDGIVENLVAPSATRARWMSLLVRRHVAFVASGHLHKFLNMRCGAVRHVWAPATAYRSGLKVGLAAPMLGFLEFQLFPDGGWSVQALVPPGLKETPLRELRQGAAFLKDAPASARNDLRMLDLCLSGTGETEL